MRRDRIAFRPALLTSLLIGIALVSGCASTGDDSPSLFVLNNGPLPATGTPNATQPSVMIAPVDTAPYLNQGGIVYQTGPYRIVVANNNRWASPLAGQLTDTLYDVLSQRMTPMNVVRATAHQSGLFRLETRVTRFYGSHDGSAHIAGQWQLVGPSGQTLRSANFQRTVALEHNGYPALVSSLSKGWQDIAARMAPSIAAAITKASAPTRHD